MGAAGVAGPCCGAGSGVRGSGWHASCALRAAMVASSTPSRARPFATAGNVPMDARHAPASGCFALASLYTISNNIFYVLQKSTPGARGPSPRRGTMPIDPWQAPVEGRPHFEVCEPSQPQMPDIIMLLGGHQCDLNNMNFVTGKAIAQQASHVSKVKLREQRQSSACRWELKFRIHVRDTKCVSQCRTLGEGAAGDQQRHLGARSRAHETADGLGGADHGQVESAGAVGVRHQRHLPIKSDSFKRKPDSIKR